MPLYVLAFTGSAVPRWTSGERTFHSVKLTHGLYAVCERRRDVPSVSEEELRAQHAAVVELASRVDAILPARFGSLVDRARLDDIAAEHGTHLLRALDDVRGRAQMTVRILGRNAPPPPQRSAAASGREYLAFKRKAAEPQIPLAARKFLERLHPLVARERRERGAGQLLATVYHLVNVTDLARYRRAAAGHEAARIIVTGPWPPFAFTPRVL